MGCGGVVVDLMLRHCWFLYDCTQIFSGVIAKAQTADHLGAILFIILCSPASLNGEHYWVTKMSLESKPESQIKYLLRQSWQSIPSTCMLVCTYERASSHGKVQYLWREQYKHTHFTKVELSRHTIWRINSFRCFVMNITYNRWCFNQWTIYMQRFLSSSSIIILL